jgi:hypothetical protein
VVSAADPLRTFMSSANKTIEVPRGPKRCIKEGKSFI